MSAITARDLTGFATSTSDPALDRWLRAVRAGPSLITARCREGGGGAQVDHVSPTWPNLPDGQHLSVQLQRPAGDSERAKFPWSEHGGGLHLFSRSGQRGRQLGLRPGLGLPRNASTQREYASSDFDIRHRFTFSLTYCIPGKKGFAQMLEGWQINSIVTLQSAQPVGRSMDDAASVPVSLSGEAPIAGISMAIRTTSSRPQSEFRSSPGTSIDPTDPALRDQGSGFVRPAAAQRIDRLTPALAAMPTATPS